MKRHILQFILVNFLFFPISATENPSSALKNVLNPFSIDVVDDRIIILDMGDSLVKVFNSQTLQNTAIIGKVGEGPGEYQANEVIVIPTKDNLCISSIKKILFFSYDGHLLSEKSFSANFSSILPIRDHYLGFTVSLGGESFTTDFHLIDGSFKSIKLLHSGPWVIDKKTRKWAMFEVFFYGIMSKNLIVAHRTEPKVMIYNLEGILQDEIVLPKTSQPFTDQEKEKITTFMMNTARNRDRFTSLKDRWLYPESFPYIMTCRIDEPIIYVLTYNDLPGKGIETKKYNFQTKEAETVYVPLKYTALNNTMISPFCIHDRTLYQLEENDSGDWELIKSKIN